MADPNMAETLKTFASKVMTSKLKDRRKIMEDLLPYIANEELPEAAVKGIVKHLMLTLGRYQDGKSRYIVDRVVEALATHHFEKTAKAFILILTDLAEQQKKLSPCRLLSGIALNALGWCCHLIRAGYKTEAAMSGDTFNKLVYIQCLLVYGAMASQKSSITQAAYTKLSRVWKQIPGSALRYADAVTQAEQTLYLAVMMSCLMRNLASTVDQSAVQTWKATFIDHYVKYVVATRTRPSGHLLTHCRDLLRHVSHEDFKNILLPAVNRAMLRNPEIILEGITYLLGSVSIDLSPYSAELGKHLAQHLHAKETWMCDVASRGTVNLAKQCSDPSAVCALVKYYFGVLNGSEGKLTVTEQRLWMLTGIGQLSHHTVSGAVALNDLSSEVAEHFVSFLQQEVHEGTLVRAIAMLTLWCSRFTRQLPDKLVQWFKTGPGLKSSTSLVKNAYFQCMNVAFSGQRLQQAAELMPLLLQAVERAAGQPTQVVIVSEGLAAACLLLKLAAVDIEAGSKLGNFWPVVLDMDKQLFFGQRFVASASDESLQNVATFFERIILDHPQRLPAKAEPLYRAMVAVLTKGSYSVRKHTLTCLRKVLSTLGAGKVAVALLQEFHQILTTQKVIDPYSEMEGAETSSDVIAPRLLHETLLSLSHLRAPEPQESHSVAMKALIDAHHPCIMAHNNSAWTEIVARLKLDAREVITTHIEEIMLDLKRRDEIDESVENMVATLSRIAPEAVLSRLVEHSIKVLVNPALVTVTKTDYEIMLTPDGELFDKSVMESGAQTEERVANIRRENKLYSYADQMAEIELKKEMEKKKKKTQKDVPKLSKKQQEALDAQLAVESQIRQKTRKLDMEVESVCRLVIASVRGAPTEVRRHIPALLRAIVQLFLSPLAAPRVTKVFEELRKAAFGQADEYLGCLVCHATLRLLRPQCELSTPWSEEPLIQQTARTLAQLHKLTVPDKGGGQSAIEKQPAPLLAPSFAYCFYLLRSVVQNGGAKVEGNEKLVAQALEIIAVHAKLRSEESDPESEEGPELLPRREMVELLTHVVGTNTGVTQQLAASALLNTCQAASGLPGCAAAEQDEINVLLAGLQAPAAAVREAVLQGLLAMDMMLPDPETDPENGMQLLKRIWVAKHEENEDNTKLADRLWEVTGIETNEDLCMLLVDDVIHHEEVIRSAAAVGLAEVLGEYEEQLPSVLNQLLTVYQEKLYQPPPVMDKLGRVVSESPPDEYLARCGVALALYRMSSRLPEEKIPVLFEFFVQKALGDRNEEVRKHMLTAAVTAINDHGKANVSGLLPVFEDFLAKAPNTASYDAVRQSVVILMGSLAKHLDKDDPKVKPIVGKLIETLSTPSQQVQEAVANCLPPLVPAIKPDAPNLVKQLLRLLLESEHYGERKGAAYGLAGLVKGLGILALKQLDIMSTLQKAIENKKNPRYREGALFAFEMLCIMLGRLFEPYVVHILPHLLLCFGDNHHYVRQAADDTAKAVMCKLSAHGVKLVLPSLLGALEEESWRTKIGSVELLGAMAFCAPKQLSACLPNIVPKLTEVLTDSHHKVQTAGIQALNQIGSVIRNPEIQAIVPDLLRALQDPTRHTTPCLQTLLDTKFVHFIDAPSLALMMPVVQRAFMDRSTETRKMAAQIIGNMYSLTDQKDLAPYLPTVIPGLKTSLLDPVPEVRTVSARALGAIVRGMGESGFEDLLPWLMQTLTSETSPVDRSGAAQGLSEVVGGLGEDKLKKLMPDIIQTSERTDIAAHVRDGYIMMYIYLPSVFGKAFQAYVGDIVPSILKALADENEYVRDTALRAGQRIVQMYADTAIEMLLPQLESGLFDDNWRIRYSSVQLLGDLLYRISGVSGKMSTETADEDDNFGTERSQHAIMLTLGTERRNRVLSGLYMGRSDTALMVRQAALHVWKVIVAHTPKTLREILPTLFQQLLSCLASSSYEKRQVAARTLGDVVRKLGEKVLPEIIPILEKGLDSERSDERQGVCIGLSEIMRSTSRDHVIVFADSLIPTVRRALCDPLPEVREAAAQTFDNLHTNIGSRALDDILPNLLESLDDEEQSEFALDGLKQVMAVKSRVVLPYLVPQLTASPVNTRALSFLSAVAGDALTKHLQKILPALMDSLSSKMGTPDEQEELEYCQTVILSVQDELGVRTVMNQLLDAMPNSDPAVRLSAVTLLQAFCQQTKADYSEYVLQLFRGLLFLFTDDDERVLEASWECLNAVTKKLDPSEMFGHIVNLRQALRFAVSDFKGEELPGFCLPKKGIAPIWPIFRKGLLDGTPEMKESAAVGLGEVIRRTSAEALRQSVINITGPLIRILSERFSCNVKVAVLETLGLLLGKCGAMLKAFLPQLQTTFIKALNDPNRAVRLKAAAALGRLVVIHTRVEPVFTELHTGVKNTEDVSIRETMLQALRVCIGGAGSKMSDVSRKQMTATLEGLLATTEDTTRIMAAACLGALCQHLPDDEMTAVLTLQLLDTDPSLDWTIRHGRVVALSVALKETAEKVTAPAYKNKVLAAMLKYCAADRIPLCLSGYRAIGFFLRHELLNGEEPNSDLIQALVKTMKHESNDVKALGAQIVNYVSKSTDAPLPLNVSRLLVPMLVNGSRERNTVVRSHSETAMVNVLHMRKSDAQLQKCLSTLEPGMRESLTEITSKVLRRVATMPDTFDDDIDDTILV